MKTKSNFLRMMFILVVVFLEGQLSVYAAKTAWVKFDSNSHTLTFYYSDKSSFGTDEFLVNDNVKYQKDCTWNTATGDEHVRRNTYHVVFDPSFADARPKTCAWWFERFYYMWDIKGLEYLNTSEVTSMLFMFSGCSRISSLDLLHFNTKKVTNMQAMFNEVEKITTLDLSSFDTQNVINMNAMFADCTNLETVYVSDGFKVNSNTDTGWMFYNTLKIKGDIGNCDMNGTYATADGGYFLDKTKFRPWVKYADGTLTFQYGHKYSLKENEYDLNTDKNIPGWHEQNPNVTKVNFDETFAQVRPTTCYYWFHDCNQLSNNKINGFNNLNTSETKILRDMFGNCSSFTSLDLSTFNTEKCEDMAGMFNHCENLSSLNISSFKTDNVKDMCWMFFECSSLTTLDLTNFNTKSLYNTNHMFFGCSNLKTIYADNKFNSTKITSSNNMFAGCNKLIGNVAWNSNNAVDKTYASIDGYFTELSTPYKGWVEYDKYSGTLAFHYTQKKTINNTSEFDLNTGQKDPAWAKFNSNVKIVNIDEDFRKINPTSTWKWFINCSQLTSENLKGLNNLCTSEVTTMEFMFRNCSKLTELDLSNFNFSNVTSIRRLVSGCTSLKKLNLRNFSNKGNIKSMFCAFADCTALTDLNLDWFDTNNVTDMGYLFYGCSSLESLSITRFNTSNVTNMYQMFGNCSKLKSIYVSSNFVLNPIVNGEDMFKGCTNLVGYLPYDENYVDTTYAKEKYGYFIAYTDNYRAKTWAEYNPSDRTLTFKYDYSRPQNQYVYDLNSDSEDPGWIKDYRYNNINKIVFDHSFAYVRPTSCYKWFYYCTKLSTIEGIENLNTSECTNMAYMFYYCYGPKSLDLSNFDTRKVTDMNKMLWNCNNSIYLSDKFVTPSTVSDIASPASIFYCSPSTYNITKANSVFADRTIKPYVNINAKAEYGTICVPLGSSLAEGSFSGFDKLYTIKSADKDKCTITMEEATTIEPGVAYVYRRNLPEGDTESIITFDADNSATATDPKNDGSLLKGTFSRITAPGGCYILQSDGNFHPVAEGNTTLGVGAYKAYLDLSSLGTESEQAKNFQMVFEDKQTTGIKGISDQADLKPMVYFDLMGRRVATPRIGGIYIVNGKKVIYKN